MGAHAVLISVKAKKAQSTALPMAVVDRFRVNQGYPVKVTTDLRDHLAKHFPKEYEFLTQHDDAIIESDAHGQLCAQDVVFEDNERDGYYFDYSNF